MKKFTVTIKEVYTVGVEVEADCPDHARSLAETLLENGSLPDTTYQYTMPKFEWRVLGPKGNDVSYPVSGDGRYADEVTDEPEPHTQRRVTDNNA